MTAVDGNMDDLLLDPLRGESFCLSSYLANMGASITRRENFASSAGESYTISLSKTLVGPPPETVSLPHAIDTIVSVSGLSPFVTDSEVKRYCTENFARPRLIYMHVTDLKTGLFSGTCIVEFSDVLAAQKCIQAGVLSCRARKVTLPEFDSLVSTDWCMLDHGPPHGVFSTTAAAPRSSWNTAGRPPASNPWQK